MAYRLRQEAINAGRLLFPPHPDKPKRQALSLPDGAVVAAKLRGSEFAAEAVRVADSILAHRFPLLGCEIETGPEIEWRRDYLYGRVTGPDYFARVPYLDFDRAGDHKVIWELNRHQHLVLLAQAWLLFARPEYLEEIWRELQSWLEQNPYPRGINWASALEAAFRALSWMWVDHLAGARMPASLRSQFLECLYVHGLHLFSNLSIYFSPNTHLLGEAIALHALGVFFGERAWSSRGAAIVDREVLRQVRADGVYFEQSSYYHVYALDMLLFHAILRPPSEAYRERLWRMARVLRALLGPQGEIPLLGDDDGGRFFHPFGKHARYGCATLAACAAYGVGEGVTYRAADLHPIAAWWLGIVEGERNATHSSELFAESGFAILTDGITQCVVDAGPFGPFQAGHTHASKLSFTLCRNGEWLLLDPGTYTYVADASLRDRFRGTAMHNTVRIDGRDQADPGGPFAWNNRPTARVTAWSVTKTREEVEAECRYRGLTHRRRIEWEKPSRIKITDEIEGDSGMHQIEQFWHAGSRARRIGPREFALGAGAALVLDGDAEITEGGEFGWRSPAFAMRLPSPVIRLSRSTSLPARLEAAITLNE